MKKRIVCMILALVFVFVVAACTNNAGTKEPVQSTVPPTTQNATKPAESTQASTLAPYDMTIVYMGQTQPPKDMSLVQDEVNKYIKDSLNAKITFSWLSVAAYAQQVRLMLTSGEKMDLFMTGTLGNGTVFDFNNQATNGQLYALNDLLEKYGKGIKDALGQFIGAGTVSGKIYAVADVRNMGNAQGLAYRKDLAAKYNIDMTKVKTLNDVESVLAVMKTKEPGMTMCHFGQDGKSTIADGTGFLYWVHGDPLTDMNGVLLNLNELKVADLYQSKEYSDLLAIARRWFKAGYISPSAATQTETSLSLVKADKLFSFMQNWKPGIDQQVIKQSAKDMATVKLTDALSTTSTVCNFMWGIPFNAKNPERSMMFLNLLYSDPYIINLIDWGIENKHYVKLADGTINFPAGIDNTNNPYAMNQGFAWGNQLRSYVFKGDAPDLWKQMEVFNKGLTVSKAMGFMFNNSSVKSEIAAVATVKDQYTRPLETGTVDSAEKLPEFISKLKAAGIDKIVAEKQKQLDEWAKANGIK